MLRAIRPHFFVLASCLFSAGFQGSGSDLMSALRKHITEEKIKAHLTTLADDAMEGRNAGTEGFEKAVQYALEQYKKSGLKPPPGQGDHLQPFEFTPRKTVKTSGKLKGKHKTHNILAYVEGQDPELKKTLVVMGAHLDHAGKAGQDWDPGRLGKPTDTDKIWNGANDNSSGSSALLAIASALGSGEFKTKRSILLISFSAEEHGLLGSQYYVENPIVPLDRHVAMINMDSVGRRHDKPLNVYTAKSHAGWEPLVRKMAEKVDLNIQVHDSAWPSGMASDHMSFTKKKIPGIGLFTGAVPERHTPQDEAERIDFPALAQIAQFAFLTAMELANHPDALK